MASGVHMLNISGLQPHIKTDLNINKEGSLVRIYADNGAVRLELTAECLIMADISAYCEDSSL